MSQTPPSPPKRFARFGRVAAALGLFCGGLLASGVFSGPVPAAPLICLPALGCIDTSIVPTVTVPTLPTVTAPTVSVPTVTVPITSIVTTTTTPVTTTVGTTTSSSGGSAATTSTTAGGAPTATATTSAGATKSTAPSLLLTAKTSVRVRGHGAKRVLVITLRTSHAVRVTARLHRSGKTLARKQLTARRGSSTFLVRVGPKPKPGAARFTINLRTTSGATAAANYRLRLPR